MHASRNSRLTRLLWTCASFALIAAGAWAVLQTPFGLSVSSMVQIRLSMPLNRRFDSEVWKSGGRRVHAAMSMDLVSSEMLIGESRSEVLELLGFEGDSPPTGSTRKLQFLLYASGELNSGAPRWLEVIFGDDDRVLSVRLTD